MSDKETKHRSDQTASPSKKEKNLKDHKNWPKEYGGPEGPEPTRYGDWEVGGRCSDF